MLSIEPKVKPNSDYYFHMPSAIARKLYLYPVVLGHFFYEEGYHLIRNHHNSFLVMYIENGSGKFSLVKNTEQFSSGDFVLLDCHTPHEYFFDQDSEVYWLHFDGSLAEEYYHLITYNYGNVLTMNSPYNALQALKKAIQVFQHQKTINEASLSRYITSILDELVSKQSYSNLNTSQTQNINHSIAYIQEHFNSSITLEQLAAISNLSPYYFTRIFTAETGITPHQFLIVTRLNAAKFHLRTQGLSIKEIAFSCGFNSESSFCSTFKKWEHMTPTEYRNQSL